MPIVVNQGEISGGTIGIVAKYTAIPVTPTVNEGGSVTINVFTELATETNLFYTVGEKFYNDFTAPTGGFSLTNQSGSFTLVLNLDRETEGTEVIPVYIRRDATFGTIVAECEISVIDTSTNPTYQVTFTSSPINEGASVTFNIATTNVLNGTILYWTKGGTTFGTDFSSPANPEFGQVTISGNAAAVSFSLINDATTEGTETIIFELRTGSNSGPIVAFSEVRIFDTSRSPGLTVTASPNPVNEGAAVTVQIPTSDGIPQGTTFFWDANIVTDITPTTGTFTIDVGQNPQAQFGINVIADKSTEGQESFIVNIRSSLGGPIVATTPPIFINDTSQNPGYAIIPNIGSPFRINEGQNVTFNISTTNVDNGTIIYWRNTGTSEATDVNQNTNFGQVTIASAAAAITLNAKLDQLAEDPGTIIQQNQLTLTGINVLDMVVTADGQNVYVGHNTTVTSLSISTITGDLAVLNPGSPIAKANRLVVHPSQTLLFAGNNNDGVVERFQRNTVTGALTLLTPIPTGGGTPNAVAISNEGNYLYALNHGGPSITIFSVTTATGALFTVTTTAVAGTIAGQPADMKIHPNGQYLYVCCGQSKDLLVYSIASNGLLTQRQSQTIGVTPSGIIIDPNGRYLFLVDNGARDLYRYKIRVDGILLQIGAAISLGFGSYDRGAIYSLLPDYLYLTDQNNQQVARFSINYSTGAVGSRVNMDLTGSGPKFIAFNPVNTEAYTIGDNPIRNITRSTVINRETLALELRTLSTSGPIVATAQPIFITDTSRLPSYFLSGIASGSVNEGFTYSMTCLASNTFDGDQLFWTINHIQTNNSDFQAVNGDFFLNNNSGTFTFSTIADSTTEGTENFWVELRTGSISGPVVNTSTNIQVFDTSLNPTYNVSRSPVQAAYDEGTTIVFNITTTDVANGTPLYWTALGTTNGNDWVGGVHFGSVNINANAASVSLTILNDASTGETTETFTFAVRTASTTGPITTSTPTLSINDTSNSPVWNITPSPNPVDEGQSVSIGISGSNIPNGTYYWTLSHVSTVDADFTPPLFGNFSVNANAGSFSIATLADLTTEGNQTFNVIIKSVSTSGPVQATSPLITINDTSLTPAYYVTTSTINVNEGASVGIIVTTTNFNPGNLFYTISGTNITNSDFSPASLFGTVAVSGSYAASRGSTTLTIANDATTGEGPETFTYRLRTFSTSGPIVADGPAITINDTSFVPGYTITPAQNNLNEGANLTINVTTIHVANATTLYWTILNGTTAAADFVSINGNFAISAAGPLPSGSGSFSVSATADDSTEGAQTFQVELRTGSVAGPVVATSSVITINDTSLTKTYGISGSPSSINEGSSVNFSVTTGNVAGGTTLYWTVTGTGLTAADFASASLSGSVLINITTPPNGSASFSVSLTNDLSGGEGTETFQIELRTGSISGPVVATSNVITVADTSFQATYAVVPSTQNVNEGSTVNFTVSTFHVANGTQLYWQTVHTSSSNNDFTQGYNNYNGQFVISASGPTLASSTVIPVIPLSDDLTEGSETFRVDILTAAAPQGDVSYTTAGTFSWTCPAGVTSVCVACIGGGGGGAGYPSIGAGSTGGGGGGLGWKNNIPVTPGNSYTVQVGAGGTSNTNAAGGAGGDSFFISLATVSGNGGGGGTTAGVGGAGGGYTGDGGGNGGNGGSPISGNGGSGGGGAGGYAGNGGNGGSYLINGTQPIQSATDGSGGAAGGGETPWGDTNGNGNFHGAGSGGGGVSIFGQYTSGLKGLMQNSGIPTGGGGGSSGTNGVNGTAIQFVGAAPGGAGGLYGGGGGGGTSVQSGFFTNNAGGAGGRGAVRIMWGSGRSYPNNLVPTGATVVASSVLVTIGDTSLTPTWSSSRSAATINEGDTVTFTITTTNVPPGTYNYTLSGISGADFGASAALGTFSVSGSLASGSASIPITLSNDLSINEGTETFVLQIRTGSYTGPIVHTTQSVTVNDTSFTPTIILTHDVSVNEGGSLAVNYTSYHLASQTLYATINFVSGSSAADFNATTINFNITASSINGVQTASGNFNVSITEDFTTETTTETFSISVRTGSATGPIIATSGNITINDTSKTVQYSLSSSAYNYNEGATITIDVTAVNGVPGTTLYWEVSGTNVTAADFGGNSLTGTVQLTGTLPGSGNLTGDILVVAGGGSGGQVTAGGVGGGGGAGGVVHNTGQTFVTGLYAVQVGTGALHASGTPSFFGTRVANGGGLGGRMAFPLNNGGIAGSPGGSGGGGGGFGSGGGSATQPTSASGGFGNAGGGTPGSGTVGAGGGGASQAGYNSSAGAPPGNARAGGDGYTTDISGTNTTYGGGGGGGITSSGNPTPFGRGGAGGGGAGGIASDPTTVPAPFRATGRLSVQGTDGLGGGGGGGQDPSTPFTNPSGSKRGGNGVIIWKVANNASKSVIFSAGITYSTNSSVAGYTIYTITAATGGQTVSVVDATTRTGSFQLALSNDNSLGEGAESFVINLRTGSASGPIVATSPTFTINDTSAIPQGQYINDVPGTYSFPIPANVNQISVVCVGAGGAGSGLLFPNPPGFYGALGGGGGALAYKNNITVTPGQTVTVVVGTRATGGPRGFSANASTDSWIEYPGGGGTIYARAGGGFTTTAGQSTVTGNFDGGGGGGERGSRTTPTLTSVVKGGGGGAGGYSGVGGAGYFHPTSFSGPGPSFGGTAGATDSGAAGGGTYVPGGGAYGGGGVGIFGKGTTGSNSRTAPIASGLSSYPGKGGSGGSDGGPSPPNSNSGGTYGGGGGGTQTNSSNAFGARGGNGVVRIIWGGGQRTFPNNNVGNF